MGKHHRSTRVLFESLEDRTFLSATPLVGAVNAAATTSANPATRYRAPALTQTTTTSADSTSSQSYFDLKKRMTTPMPVLTTDANVSQWSSNQTSAVLSAFASYSGAGGNTALTYTWSATNEPTGATPVFSDNGDYSAKSVNVIFNRAGAYTFTVSISNGMYAITDTVNVTVAATVSHIVVTPGSSQLGMGTTQQFSASVYDEFNMMSVQPVAWSVTGQGSIGSNGLYNAGSSTGTAVVQASAGGVTASTSVLVTAGGAPVIATPASSGSSTVTGTSTTLSVLGADDGGEAGLTYTWSAVTVPAAGIATFGANGTNAAKNTTVSFNEAGNYSFLVTVSDGLQSVTSTVNLTVAQTLKSITVLPSDSSLNLNQATSLTATGYDQFGTVLTVQPAFNWSKSSGVGSVNAGGNYSSANAGSATITASSGGVSGTANITVTNAAPVVVNGAVSGSFNVTGTSTTLSTLGSDDGGANLLTYTWSTSIAPAGGAATFSVNGTNAAKNSVVTFNEAGVYSFLVTISDGSLTVTSSTMLVVSPTLTSISLTGGGNIGLNQSTAFTASGLDQFGAPLATQPTITWSKVSGIGTIDGSGNFSSATSGTATVRASSGSIGANGTVTVMNAAPTIATPASSGLSTVAGTNTTLSVLAADDGGEGNLTYSWTTTSAPSGGVASFSINGTNASKNTTVSFNKAGSYTFLVTVSDGSLTTSSSVTLTVAQTLSSLVVTPGSTGVALNGTQQFSATGKDQFGATMASQPAVTWAISSGVGTIGTTGLYNAGGSIGSATILATSGGITGTATASVGNTAPTIATPAASGSSNVIGTNTTLSVLGADDGGESNLTYSWTTTAAPAGGVASFSINATNASKNTTVSFNKAGSYSFLVTISDGSLTVTSSVTLNVAQTLSTISVTPGNSNLNLNQTTTFSAVGFDQFGAAMTTQPAFTWSKLNGTGSINSSGVYSSAAAGSATIKATAGGVIGTNTVAVTNAAPTVLNTATAGSPTVTGTSTALAVFGADDGGEAGLTYAWSTTSAPSGGVATFSVNGTNASKNTTVSFNEAGSYSFLVTISDGSLTVTSSVSLMVVQTLSTISVTPGGSVNENQTASFSATALDQFGAAMATQQAFTWSKVSGVGSVNSNGVFSSTSAGTATIKAASGSVSGSNTVTVTNAAPTIVNSATAGNPTVTGTSTTLAVLGADDGGESNLNYSWSATSAPAGGVATFTINGTNASKNTTVSFNEAGTYTFLVTISDGSLTTSSSVTLTVAQTLSSIVVSSGGTLSINQSATFTAAGKDQFGAVMASQPAFTWTVSSGVGSVNSSGIFSSGTAGSATIQASSGSVSGSNTVSVTNGAPTVATPATIASQTSTTATLSVLGADGLGESALSYSWSVVSAPGGASPTFSANGSNAAKNTTVTFNYTGVYTFLVTISDGTSSVTSSTTVNVAATTVGLNIAPGTTTTLAGGATQQFTVTGTDQFGHLMSVSPAWSVLAGGNGSINSGGLFTAGTTSGTATVQATVGSLTATAGVTVTAGSTGNAVTLSTNNLGYMNELVITGTTGNDSIVVSQSGTTFTIVSNGTTQTISGTFGDLAIHAGSGGSSITVNSSVTINTLVYGGAGTDTIHDSALGSYNAVVTIGGGNDTVTGNGLNTNYWADTGDTINASSAEISAGHVNRVASFYQPFTTDPTNPAYVPLTLAGQNLQDPTDIGTPVHYNKSLFGTGPVMTDVNQGQISDCYLLAAIQSLAYSSPAKLESLAVDLGDGTYAVRFNQYGSSVYVRVDGDMASFGAYNSNGNLWPMVFEKAYAYFRDGANTYNSLNIGFAGDVYSDLGIANSYLFMSTAPATLAAQMSTALANGKGVALQTLATMNVQAPIILDHAYSLVSITPSGGTWILTIRNPWGFDGAGSDSNPSDGLVQITMAQLTADFGLSAMVS